MGAVRRLARRRRSVLAAVVLAVAVALAASLLIVVRGGGGGGGRVDSASVQPASTALASVDAFAGSLASSTPASGGHAGELLSSAARVALRLATEDLPQLQPMPAAELARDQATLTPAERRKEQDLVDAALPTLRALAAELSAPLARPVLASTVVPDPSLAPLLRLDVALRTVASSSIPGSVAGIEDAASRLHGPTVDLVGDLEAIASGKLLLNPFAAISAVQAVISLADEVGPLLVAVARGLKTLLEWVVSAGAAVLDDAGRVGPGWPPGRCPPGDFPLLCWLLQGDNGQLLSNALTIVILLSGAIGFVCLVATPFTLGLSDAITAVADVVSTISSILQVGVDTVRLSGYSSLGDKVRTLVTDTVGVFLSVVDLSAFGAAARVIKGIEAEHAITETLLDGAVDLFGLVDKDGRSSMVVLRLFGKLDALDHALDDAKEAATIAGQIVNLLYSVSATLTGPLAGPLRAAANFIANLLRALFGLGARQHRGVSTSGRVTVTACQDARGYEGSLGPLPRSVAPPDGIALPAGASLYGVDLTSTPGGTFYVIGPSGMVCSVGRFGRPSLELSRPNWAPPCSSSSFCTFTLAQEWPVLFDFNNFFLEPHCAFREPDPKSPRTWCGVGFPYRLYPAGTPLRCASGSGICTPSAWGMVMVPSGARAYLSGLAFNGNGDTWPPTLSVVVDAPDAGLLQGAWCDLPADPRICVAALQLFVEESAAYTATPNAPRPAPRKDARRLEDAIASALGG